MVLKIFSPELKRQRGTGFIEEGIQIESEPAEKSDRLGYVGRIIAEERETLQP
jgi:hypothetical protein